MRPSLPPFNLLIQKLSAREVKVITSLKVSPRGAAESEVQPAGCIADECLQHPSASTCGFSRVYQMFVLDLPLCNTLCFHFTPFLCICSLSLCIWVETESELRPPSSPECCSRGPWVHMLELPAQACGEDGLQNTTKDLGELLATGSALEISFTYLCSHCT